MFVIRYQKPGNKTISRKSFVSAAEAYAWIDRNFCFNVPDPTGYKMIRIEEVREISRDYLRKQQWQELG